MSGVLKPNNILLATRPLLPVLILLLGCQNVFGSPLNYVSNPYNRIYCQNEHKYVNAGVTEILGGVGHCFAWHVRVSLGLFQFNFKTEELVHSVLCAM
jgi:hypothetical protein